MNWNRIKQLVALLTIFVVQTSAGQSLQIKMKYEEAEKAFEDGDYATTLVLVEEVEKMYKSTSPKTLYLKILATQKSGISDFKKLQTLRTNCTFFLDKYDNVDGIEDRYRDVYELSKTLKTYPNTEEAFVSWNQTNQKKAKATETLKERERLSDKMKRTIADIDGSMDWGGLKLGMPKSEVPGSVWSKMSTPGLAVEKGYIGFGQSGNFYSRKTGMKIKPSQGISAIMFDDQDRLIGTWTYMMVGGKSEIPRITDTYQEGLKSWIDDFGKEHLVITDTSYTINKTKYTFASVRLKHYAPSQVEMSMTIMEMGGVLGTQADLSFSRRNMGVYESDLKQ